MAVLRAGDVALHYEVHGHGAGMLGIHGTPGSAVLWADAARRLAAVGRCVIYDRRGFGRSGTPGSQMHLAEHVADAVVLVERVVGVPAVVIGRSTGGLVALALAVRRPDLVRALVLLEPAVLALDVEAAAWAAGVRAAALRAEPGRAGEAVMRAVLGDGGWTELPREVADILVAASPAVLAELHGDQLDLSTSPYRPSDVDLRSMDRPTLLVTAERSPEPLHRVNDHLAAVLPRSVLQVARGDHLIDPAGPEVLEFIRRLP